MERRFLIRAAKSLFFILLMHSSLYCAGRDYKAGEAYNMYLLHMSKVLHAGSSEGFILIKSTPAGAIVYIEGVKKEQLTPFQAQLEEGNYSYTLQYDKYHDHHGTFTIRPGETTILDIELKAAFGSVFVSSNPEGADILLDDVPTGKMTPALLTEISFGEHIIMLKKSMYSDVSGIVLIEDGKTPELFVDIPGVPGTGKVTISTKPEANIRIDDILVGTGSYIGLLHEGKHIITITKPNYKIEENIINIVNGQMIKLDFELIPFTGTLAVICSPPETDIFLDGVFYERSPRIIHDLVAGTYNLELRRSGYRTLKKGITITRDKTTTISDSLVAGGIEITVDSRPLNAELLLDGKLIGETPFTFITVPGDHKLLLQADYYYDMDITEHFSTDYSYNYIMEPKTRKAIFHSTPGGAAISIDTVPSGRTKAEIEIFQGVRSVKMERDGFISEEHNILFDSLREEVMFLMYPEKYREKGQAFLYSLMVPGAGQSYLERGSMYYLMGFAGYGLLAGTYVMHSRAVVSYDKYLESSEVVERQSLKKRWQSQLVTRNYFLMGAGFVWGFNLVWTLLIPSEEKRYEKLKMLPVYDNITETAQVGLVINF